MKRVFLAGEGRNDLGKWAYPPHYQNNYGDGVIYELLSKVETEGWQVTEGQRWKDVIKYTTGGHRADRPSPSGGGR